MKEALTGTTAATPIEIWFQDEARVGQKGTHAYVWAPVGSRPLMVRDNRHDSAYIFGAICPARGAGAAMIMPAANTEGMNEHLKEISTQIAPNSIAVVICDGAGWHQRGKDLIVPDNIRLLSLRIRQSSTRWRTSGTTCGKTSCVLWSGTHTTTFSKPAKPPGTG